ncbi:hypothetical protein NQZ68_040725 [Dissostichus eleginoides]|nr:hypothetical protein NQZ68_040725 [Dissostichus eleginoides]
MFNCCSHGTLLHFGLQTDSDFHGHRPAVYIDQHLFWGLMSVGIGRLNPAFGSSRSASSAYQKSDDRFARQDRYGPPPEFPLASPCPGIVHHLSGPIARAHAPPPRQCGRDGPVVRPAPRAGIPPQPARAGPHFHCATGRTGNRGPRPSPGGERGSSEHFVHGPGKRRGPGGGRCKARGRSREPPSPRAFPSRPRAGRGAPPRRKCARRGPASAGERSHEEILPHRAADPDPPS